MQLGALVPFTDTGGEGRVILLLHGVCMSRMFFEHNATALAQRHRVIAVDFRSHGGSHGASPDPAGHDAAEALEAPFFGEIPLALDIGDDADHGTPSVVINPDGAAAQIFRNIASQIAAQVSIRNRSFTPLTMMS